MFPSGRLAVVSKTTLVIETEDSAAAAPGNLAAEAGAGRWIHERENQRTEPIRSLWRGIGIQKYSVLGPGKLHAVVHNAAGIVLPRLDLDEMLWLRAADEINRPICRTRVDYNQFPISIFLRGQSRESLAESPCFVKRTHDYAHQRIGHIKICAAAFLKIKTERVTFLLSWPARC